MTPLLLRHLETVDGTFDVRCRDGRITEIGSGLAAAPDEDVLAEAASALPGLHDHHLHLMAMAARADSVDLGGLASQGRSAAEHLGRAAATLGPSEWLRAVGYDEQSGGHLDRWSIDRQVPGVPVRVQHRSGHLWILNSMACTAVGLDDVDLGGIERDASGVATGRLFDLDSWLSTHLPAPAALDLGAVSRRLASYGVTSVTDATPYASITPVERLADARATGEFAQRITATGGIELADAPFGDEVGRGPVKLLVADHRPPDLDGLIADIERAHCAGHAVAVHCVSRIAGVVAVLAWEVAGVRSGDRMEHGAVLAPETAERLAALGVIVVTQPAFLWASGDRYLRDVATDEQPLLYPCASLQRAGVTVAGSTDAPFGPEDPWRAMASARDRTSASGAVLGAHERLDASAALGLFLSPAARPGQVRSSLEVGMAADLCLFDCPLTGVVHDLDGGHLLATLIAGEAAYRR